MSTRALSEGDDPVLTDFEQLLEPMRAGEKPPADWRIGTEHEKLVYRRSDHHAPSYGEEGGIADILAAMARFGWTPIEEDGRTIALKGADGNISLEPAGQLELSGAPLETLHETCAETGRHLEQVKQLGEELDIGFLGLGLWPDKTRDELPVMPKARYEIMMRHMPKVGSLGLDMMLRTATIQVNLDYSGEADMAKKFRVGLALQPLATALFANSPFLEGAPNGYLSYRSHIWSDTDAARTGMLPFVFDEGFGYGDYARYMLDVPMYFVYRDGRYIDAAGQSFRDFMDARLPALPGERPRMSDWMDHLSTAFPEVRLKSFLEMRGADSGPWSRICALPAFWVGLLYDAGALDAAWERVRHWPLEGRQALRDAVPERGLKAVTPDGAPLRELAVEILNIAREGLSARRRVNAGGDNETGFLDPLFEIADSGLTPAERLLELYRGEWDGDVSRIYRDSTY